MEEEKILYRPDLTKAEKRFLPYLCWKDKDIAKELNLSVRTVKVHIHNMIQKFEVKSREEMIVESIKLGLLNVYNVKLRSEYEL